MAAGELETIESGRLKSKISLVFPETGLLNELNEKLPGSTQQFHLAIAKEPLIYCHLDRSGEI